jgi:integrase/recombinase XerD
MNMPSPSRVRVDGPLAPYALGFRQELSRVGYSSSPAAGHLQLMAHLSCWLAVRDLEPGELTGEAVEQFLECRRASGRVHRRLSLRGMAPLLEYLREQAVVPQPEPPVAVGLVAELLEEFTSFLVQEQGLAAPTVANYHKVAKAFLSAHSSQFDEDGLVIRDLAAGDVIGFILGEAQRLSTASLNNATTGLRALLRFLHVRGYMPVSLVGAVPAAPGWRDTAVPRGVEPAVVDRLLDSCDRRTTIGRRDFAILMLLARLALRSGEVARLSIDDVDWRAGELVVSGKGNRCERLPLPHDVGEAIAGYCRRGRRRGSCRSLFLHVHAPYAALSPSGIREVVARACMRAGLAPSWCAPVAACRRHRDASFWRAAVGDRAGPLDLTRCSGHLRDGRHSPQ